MNDLIKKELHVAIHGQTAKFRLVKYAVLIPLFGAIYWWGGSEVLLSTIGVLAIVGVIVHFFFRYKTNGWQDDWWLYKSLYK